MKIMILALTLLVGSLCTACQVSALEPKLSVKSQTCQSSRLVILTQMMEMCSIIWRNALDKKYCAPLPVIPRPKPAERNRRPM